MEEIMTQALLWVAHNHPVAGSSIMAICAGYAAIKTIVALTPTKKDDKFLDMFRATPVGKALDFIARVPFKKKQK